MEVQSTFSKAIKIQELLKTVSNNRHALMESFLKAYLASVMDKDTNLEELIKRVKLIENWSKDGMSVAWHFEVM